jgi:hypothetical protein
LRLLLEQSGWQLPQCPVGAFFVIKRNRLVGNVTDPIQVFKEISDERLKPIGSVKALDKSSLAKCAELDITQLDIYNLQTNSSISDTEPYQ